MTAPILPICAWVPVTTHRLRAPNVLWTSPEAHTVGFEPNKVYCCPNDYEAADSYTDETRQEGADRYGGIGVGNAGGSGRCSSFVNGLQTKGVGVTPLVGPGADRFHSSGTLMLVEAATEAVFAGAYQAALPFGAVPVHAVVATGGEYLRELDHDSQARCLRALAIRQMVVRPAHFMRNILHPSGRESAGAAAKGWSMDAVRTRQALSLLATNMKQTLGLLTPDSDEMLTLDAGLRELVRRYAWQCSAAFAKRLPHGTQGCSNIALSGAYMDFGLSNHLPSYRRMRWAQQDPWTEAQFPLNTLLNLRRQLGKYHLGSVREGNVVSAEEMAASYSRVLQERLAIEMVRMAGLTEDMAIACPPELLGKWFRAMRSIWMRGADEQFVSFSGHMSDGQPTPAPRWRRQYDLNAVLTAAGPHSEPLALDAALRPHLDDPALRQSFVTAAVEVRAWLQSWTGAPAQVLDAYLGRQAARKNAVLDLLRRDENASLAVLRRLEIDGDTEHVGAAINAALRQARQGLADLCPALPGINGLEQLKALSESSQVRHSPAESGQEPVLVNAPA